MSFNLPGMYLYYLSRDNLAPEEYERIISPHAPGRVSAANMNLTTVTIPAVTLSICGNVNSAHLQISHVQAGYVKKRNWKNWFFRVTW
ncbi:hypothetical protein ADT36_14880 [Yersinia pestis subsp. microtus bv. Caucasica]|nr:hypothetical protein ADT36_14880 [Yersinia pestis subsp. microtus bv. Caucasica]